MEFMNIYDEVNSGCDTVKGEKALDNEIKLI